MLVREGKVQRLSVGGTVLGIERDMRYNQEVVQLQPRDVLVLATDGVFEAMDFKEEVFGRARMEQAMMTAIQRGDDANGIAKHILWELRRFTGLQARTDDLTLVAVRVV